MLAPDDSLKLDASTTSHETVVLQKPADLFSTLQGFSSFSYSSLTTINLLDTLTWSELTGVAGFAVFVVVVVLIRSESRLSRLNSSSSSASPPSWQQSSRPKLALLAGCREVLVVSDYNPSKYAH